MKTFVVIFCCCYLLLSADAWSQDFSSLDNDLGLLQNLIADTLSNMEEQQKRLEDLKQNLNESDTLISSYRNTITEQENLLKGLQVQLNEMSETYRMQSSLSARYARSSRFWRTFTLAAIPVTAIISGGLVWAIMR